MEGLMLVLWATATSPPTAAWTNPGLARWRRRDLITESLQDNATRKQEHAACALEGVYTKTDPCLEASADVQ